MSNKKSQINLSKIFLNTKIYDPINQESVQFKDLWENSKRPIVLIHFLRRFGWPLCRLGAQELSSSIEKINEKFENILDFAAIGLAKLDYEEFEQGKFVKGGKIYIDEVKETYKSLDFGSKSIFSLYGMLNPDIYRKSSEAKAKGITGNMRGDGTQLGGTLIVDNKGDVIFIHEQKTYSDFPKEQDLFDAVQSYVEKNKNI